MAITGIRDGLLVIALALLAIVHGLVGRCLMRSEVPIVYWFAIFIVELSLGARAAYRFFGIIPSGDI